MLQTLQRSRTPAGATYVDRGEGAETVVLIHGVGMRAEAWTPQIERLAERHRVIAIDLPGHGLSAPLAGTPDLATFVSWAANVLSDLDLTGANIAGHSMGALIATGLAVTAPDKVRRIALLNGVHRRNPEARKAVEDRAREIASGSFDRDAPLARWFAAGETATIAYDLVREMLQDVDPDGYAAAYRAFATGDAVYADCWGKVTCPALFLTGDGDGNSTPEMAQAMAAAAVHGRAVVLAGHRHMLNLTAPDEVCASLADWLTWEVADDR